MCSNKIKICLWLCLLLIGASAVAMSKKEVIKSCLYELNITKEEVIDCLHEDWIEDEHCVDLKNKLENCARLKIIGF